MAKENIRRKLYGVGILGEGKYSAGKDKAAYKTWCGMLDRCYSEKRRELYKSYDGCIVCKEWLDFQNFAEFFYCNINERGWQIDKDILCKNNKIYSPQTCLAVPSEINKLFVRRKKYRGDLPIGVHYESDRSRYKASLHDGSGKTKFLGRFHTAEDAFRAYKEAKEKIRIHCKAFGGTLDDVECMKLTGLARNTYYKYKRQIRAGLADEGKT